MNKPSTFVSCVWPWLLAALLVPAAGGSAPADDGQTLLERSAVAGGLVVHLGCGDGKLTAQLHAGPQWMVHGLDRSAANVAAARRQLLEQGLYGGVSVDRWDGRHLPYVDNLVNLLVVEDRAEASDAELMRVLAPHGVLLERRDGRWVRREKPWPPQMDQWTHYFHDADGNPVANDSLVGPPKRLQWIGTPRWCRHHDHASSLSAMVSANGRLFYILDEGSRASIQLPAHWRLVARDAFNGVILWKRPIARWNTHQYPLKSGPAHLLRRLVAVGDRVYVTLDIDGPVLVLDAATGKTLRTLEGSQFAREIVVSDGVVFVVADQGPSKLPQWRRVSTYVWANTRAANPGWGWDGRERHVLAFDAATGQRLWKSTAPVAPCSLAADAQRVVFHDGDKLVCLDRKTGSLLWQSEPAPTSRPVHTNTGPRVLLYGDVVLFAGNNGKMSGWSAQDGRKLWEQKKLPSGHQSLKDLMVVDGLVWTGAIANSRDSGIFRGYDPRTGELKREFPPDVKVHWFHHRCYPAKGAGRFLLTARNGTEFVDVRTGHWLPNHWVRSGCIYGVMPCNGLMYATMDPCGCQLEAKLPGLKALAAAPLMQSAVDPAQLPARLEKGPAYGEVGSSQASATDWPTYRHDNARSGGSPASVALDVGRAWQTRLGGRLTAPTIADGKVFVAAVDRHTVYALDHASGKRLWAFTAGGRVDSPPTWYRGMLLFGSADGYVYALRANDGTLAWRFRAAPVDRRIMAWEQLESAWPVHGSVLVHDGVLYCTAGRNMYLDGGIHFLRLDPTSGELLGEVVMDDKDPETGQDMHLAYLKKTQGNNMPVALNDILSCDGRYLWLRSQKIDFQGKRLEIELQDVNQQPPEDCHMFCQVGFLDDSYFFRTYWTYGRRVTGGYGGWLKAGRVVPSGRILCADADRVYGFGRKPEFMVNSSVIQYQIFAADKSVTEEAIAHLRKADAQISRRSAQKNANSSDWLLRHFFPTKDLTAVNFHWVQEQPAVIARAMALSKDKVWLAGPPNLIDERQAYRMPDDPQIQSLLEQQEAALQGQQGGELWALNKSDGRLAARYRLETVPVFDGLAVADGRLYMSTTDGRLLCLAGQRQPVLPQVHDRPVQIVWDKPEDPSYLLPPEELKNEDFQRVVRGDVVACQLGYRVIARDNGLTTYALQKLPQPLTGKCTIRTRIRVPADTRGRLQNGFLAFGQSARPDELVQCGIRVRLKRAVLVQGPLDEAKTTRQARLDVKPGQLVDVIVTVDLDEQNVVCQLGKLTLQTKLDPALQRIAYVGYATIGGLADFAPVKVEPAASTASP